MRLLNLTWQSCSQFSLVTGTSLSLCRELNYFLTKYSVTDMQYLYFGVPYLAYPECFSTVIGSENCESH